MGDDSRRKMFDDAWMVCFLRFDTLTHLNSLSHHPISIAECRGKTQQESEHMESFRCIWQSGMKKDIGTENLATEKRRYSQRQINSSTWHSYPIPLPSLPFFLSRPETLWSLVNKTESKQSVYLRHGPFLVATVGCSSVVEATANRHMLIKRRNRICVMLSW